MKRVRFRIVTIVFMSAFLSTGTAAAIAGTATSAWYGPYSVGGYSYKNQAAIMTNTPAGDQGRTVVQSQSGNVPSGWMGAKARAYRTSNGALACDGSITYNSGPVVEMSVPCFFTGVVGAGYHSLGTSYGWNGSGYNSWGTYKSPSQNG